MGNCAHCKSSLTIRDFVARLNNDPEFVEALDHVMAPGIPRRVGEFLCRFGYKATAQEFVEAMTTAPLGVTLSNLERLLAAFGFRSRTEIGARAEVS
jgi:hypothetical protein